MLSETVSFPGLGLELEVSRLAFSVGGFQIYWYGVIIALGFFLGVLYVSRRAKRFGVDPDRLMDIVLVGALAGIIGARLYYVIFSWDTYKDDLLSVFNLRTGGLAIYGGIIGALLAGVIMCRVRRVKTLPCLDLAVGGILLGQAIGRWGNFFNREAFGCNTTLPWGMASPSIQTYLARHQAELAALGVTVDPSMPVHPTFFYESMWCLLGFAFLAWYTGRRRFDGELTLIYLGWYGLGRFFIEGLRTDSLMLGGVRISQLVALLCVAAAVITLVAVHLRIYRAGSADYLPLYVHTAEGQAVVNGTFYLQKDKDQQIKAPAGETAPAEEQQENAIEEDK